MLKNQKAVTLMLLVITLIVVTILASVTITTVDTAVVSTKRKQVISNMYIIKGEIETIYEEYIFLNDEDENVNVFIGTKENADTIYSTYGITTESDVDNFWYEIKSDDLETMGLSKEMLSSGGTYIVNYAMGEVIYTKGSEDTDGNIEYTLSDMID